MRKLALVFALVFFLPLSYSQDGQKKKPSEPPDEAREIQERIAHFRKAVSEMRGKKFLQDFKFGVKTREELQEYIVGKFKEEKARGEFKKLRKLLITLGLISPELDIEKSLLKMLTERIAGFYEPEKDELFLMEGSMGGLMQDITIAHEVCHALQDQHYDLDAMTKSIRNNTDRQLAVFGIVEGEATLAGFEYMLKKMNQSVVTEQLDRGKWYRTMSELDLRFSPNSALAKIPKFIREMFIFRYCEGATFVQTVLKKFKSWKELDRIFDNPPLSTEQVLHPEKYIGKVDYPVRILLPKLHKELEGEWEEVMTDSMGEFAIRVLLSEFVSKNSAATAAAGWDGDSFALIESKAKGGPTIFVWLSVWDSGKDAKEFTDAYASVLAKRFSIEARKTDTGYLVEPEKESGKTLVEFAGTQVLVIQGAPLSLVAKVRTATLSARQVVMRERRFDKLSRQKLILPAAPDKTQHKPEEQK